MSMSRGGTNNDCITIENHVWNGSGLHEPNDFVFVDITMSSNKLSPRKHELQCVIGEVVPFGKSTILFEETCARTLHKRAF